MAGEVMNLLIDEIDVSSSHRPVNAETVQRLAASIKEIGLQHPITVRSNKATARFDLIAGRHRLEAARSAKWDRLACRIVKMDDDEARMWEISENLHRAELSSEERYEQIAEYAALAKKKREAEKLAHGAPVSDKGGRGVEGGDRLAARDLGIERDTVRRAQEYAALSDEVKEGAKAADVGPTKLLRLVGKEPTPEAKLAAIERERALKDAKKANREVDGVIALTEAQQFAEWLLGRMDLGELPTLISWLEGCKPREVIAALRREAA